MNSRERLLTTLNHKEPDRIPIDLASTQVTAISLKAYQNLRSYLGLPETSPVIPDRIQQVCIPDKDIMEKFGIDVHGLWPLMNNNDFTDEEDGEYLHHIDEWGLGYRLKKEDGLTYIYVLCRRVLFQKFTSINIPGRRGGSNRRIAGLRDKAIEYRKNGFPVF